MNKTRIYRILLERIVNMHYQPGDVLNEQELCNEFKVSRTPIREVLIQLSQSDFVTIKSKVGTYVTEVDARMLKSLYEIKTPLDALVAELACSRATEDEICKLELIINDLTAFSQNGGKPLSYYHQRDREFHRICSQASRNPFLVKFLDEIQLKIVRFLNYIDYESDELDWYTETLRKILEAIKANNKERAKREAIEHNQVFLKKLSNYFFGLRSLPEREIELFNQEEQEE